jgi:hypothetical protein
VARAIAAAAATEERVGLHALLRVLGDEKPRHDGDNFVRRVEQRAEAHVDGVADVRLVRRRLEHRGDLLGTLSLKPY